jgi:hypothetical protein
VYRRIFRQTKGGVVATLSRSDSTSNALGFLLRGVVFILTLNDRYASLSELKQVRRGWARNNWANLAEVRQRLFEHAETSNGSVRQDSKVAGGSSTKRLELTSRWRLKCSNTKASGMERSITRCNFHLRIRQQRHFNYH